LVKVAAALEQLRPNFRYQEHMSTLEKELGDQNRKFEASLEASRKAAAAFEEVKKRRCTLLREFVVCVFPRSPPQQVHPPSLRPLKI